MVRFEQRGKLAELPDDLVRGRDATTFVNPQIDSPKVVLRGSEAHLGEGSRRVPHPILLIAPMPPLSL